jgi:hypothetical protein
MLFNGAHFIGKLHRWPFAVGLLLTLLATRGLAESPLRSFNLPSGDAAQTLKQFAAQAQREIMFPAESVAGVQTQDVHGTLTVRAAIDALVAGTKLSVLEDPKTGALLVTHPPAPVSRRPSLQPNEPKSMNSKTTMARLSGFLALALASSGSAQTVPPGRR